MKTITEKLADALRSIAALSVFPDDVIPEEHLDDEDRKQMADPEAYRECRITYASVRAARTLLAEYDEQRATFRVSLRAECLNMVATSRHTGEPIDTERLAAAINKTDVDPNEKTGFNARIVARVNACACIQTTELELKNT